MKQSFEFYLNVDIVAENNEEPTCLTSKHQLGGHLLLHLHKEHKVPQQLPGFAVLFRAFI